MGMAMREIGKSQIHVIDLSLLLFLVAQEYETCFI